jgi:hypothetical protein
MDRLKFPGLRGVEIAAQQWDALALGAMGERLFNYYPTSATQFNDYPNNATAVYTGVGNPPNSPNFENNNVSLIEDFSKNPSAQERWNAAGVTQQLIAALEPELIQPMCNAPDFGPHFHTGAKCGSAGTLIIAINDTEVPGSLNFPSSLWSLYNVGSAPVTRFQEIKAAYVRVTNLAAGTTSDSHTVDGGEIDVWWFPSGSTPLAQPITVGFNPASVGASKTAFRYSYLCDPKNFISNLDQQAAESIFTSATSFSLFNASGPLCYDYQYLDNSNVPVGARSSVQVLR